MICPTPGCGPAHLGCCCHHGSRSNDFLPKVAREPGIPMDPRCDIVRNGDQFLCRIHHRYWQTGICPGVK